MQNQKRRIALVGLALVAAAGALWAILGRPGNDRGVIRVSGNMEVTTVALSFKIPGRVEERLVSEGEVVHDGQLVGRLEQAELAQEVTLRRAEVKTAEASLAELLAGSRSQEVERAEAAAREAQARLARLLAGSRPQEIAAAEASLERAQAEAARRQADFKRYEGLYEKEQISAQQFDAARTAYQVAEAGRAEAEEALQLVKEGPRKEDIEQAREALRQTQAQLSLVREGPRKETIAQARARREQAQQALEIAATRLGYSSLVSPLSGLVLSKHVEAGEYVAAGTPLLTVGDLEHPWLRAYIEETDLGRVKVGQRVSLTTDTYPGKRYEGRVSFISSEAEFTPKNVQTQKERVKLVYRIKVEISNPNMELKPGMPADAEILVTSLPGDR